MENFYNSYSKVLHDKTYYFVKRYLRFPEFKNVADVLEGYGMHTDFGKACVIAGIADPVIMKQLFEEMEHKAPSAKIIELKVLSAESRSNFG